MRQWDRYLLSQNVYLVLKMQLKKSCTTTVITQLINSSKYHSGLNADYDSMKDEKLFKSTIKTNTITNTVIMLCIKHRSVCAANLNWLETCRPSADMSCGCPPDIWPFALKIGTPVTPATGNVHTNYGFFMPFQFQVTSLYMDRQMDKWTRQVMQPIRTTA